MKDDTACIDVDTLAAWADDALDPQARGRVEAHAADCERCQAMLAAMVRTLPPAEARPRWWRIPALGWMVPLATAATAIAIWIAVPAREPVPQSRSAEAPAEALVPPASAPAARPAAAPASPPDELKAKERVEKPSEAGEGRARRESDAPQRTDSLQKASPAESANALAETIAPLAPHASSAGSSGAAAPVPQADAAAPRSAPFATQRALSASSNVAETVVVSSNPATRFRLIPGGGVQRSADGGATWRTEATGATETLTAGSSPSPSVCWLIGPRGTVVLTTAGSAWRRVTFPEVVDLQTVVAADAESATVTTVDGRSFVTTNGGSTWSRSPDF